MEKDAPFDDPDIRKRWERIEKTVEQRVESVGRDCLLLIHSECKDLDLSVELTCSLGIVERLARTYLRMVQEKSQETKTVLEFEEVKQHIIDAINEVQ